MNDLIFQDLEKFEEDTKNHIQHLSSRMSNRAREISRYRIDKFKDLEDTAQEDWNDCKIMRSKLFPLYKRLLDKVKTIKNEFNLIRLGYPTGINVNKELLEANEIRSEIIKQIINKEDKNEI